MKRVLIRRNWLLLCFIIFVIIIGRDFGFSLAVERSELAKDVKTIYECLCRDGEIRFIGDSA
jgi:hypothetical protein